MHILFATTDFIDNNGPTTGLPKYLFRTSKVLTEWGHIVSIVTCSNRSVSYEFYGIRIYRVRRINVIKNDSLYENYKTECKRDALILHEKIAEIVSKEKVDIIQYTSLSGSAYYHDFNIPSVVRLSSYAKIWPYNDIFQKKACMEMELSAAQKVDSVFAPSSVVSKEFGKDLNKEVEVIETPYVLEIKKENRSIYERYFKNIKYILFYGTLVEYKGLGVIADSVFSILENNPDIHIGIIGDGEEKWKDIIIQNAGQYADRIIFVGAIGYESLIVIIKNAELIMLPSLMENFSNACVESMAQGQIVLGTNGASFEQLISDGKSGFLCEIGDSKSFLEKVNEIINLSDEKRNNIKNNAIRRIEDLKPEVVTNKLIHYYEKIILMRKG